MDLKKAFDNVNHESLVLFMEKLGFNEIWCRWIRQCIQTAYFSVLINGSPHGFFPSSKSLRQGDPLSPLLFCIYDVLVFADANPENSRGIKECINMFNSCSGLSVIVNKSEIYFTAGDLRFKNQIVSTLGYPEGKLPIKYLVLPLITTRLSTGDCQPLLGKIQKKIAMWSNKVLSRSGRIELTNSVLNAFQLYWSASFHIPSEVLNRIERILINYIWAGNSQQRSYHNVGWDVMCMPKAEGGMGLRKLQDINLACKFKQLWNLIKGNNTLWSRWFNEKYVRNRNLWTIKAPSIMSWGARTTFKHRDMAKNCICYIVDDGKGIDFLTQPWHPDGPILQQYPEGHTLRATPTNISVDQIFSNGSWDQTLIQSLPAWIWRSVLWRFSIRRKPFKSLKNEEDWIRNNFKGKLQATTALRIAFNAAIYHIWLERNSRIHELKSTHKQSILSDILFSIRTRCIHLHLDEAPSFRGKCLASNLHLSYFKATKPAKFCSWVPPATHLAKLNTDASLSYVWGGLGGLISEGSGKITAAFSINSDPNPIQKLELEAIL
ncbi:uncharacterized protein LOC143888612 [Tasmannia lanceolata]|uniref:uncharacterized protein LOC143888612 n=1 Tax=Tasmannia lanceolata TaxID=3420 RepID=UPI004063A240